MRKDRSQKNWRVVVLSIAAASTFWLFNALNKNYDTRVNYPLEFTFDRDSTIVVLPLPDRVELDVSGSGWSLLRKTFGIGISPINIALNKPTEVKFFTQSTLAPAVSGQIESLRLNYVVTDSLRIDIDEKVSRSFQVVVDSLRVPLANNYRITSAIKVEPNEVVLTGPKSLMKNIGNLVWTKFNQNNIHGSFDEDLPLDLPGNGLISSNTAEVNTTFRAEEFIEHSIDADIELLHFPDKSTYLSDSTVSITFTTRETAADIKASDFGITADYYTRDKTDSTLTPTLIYYPEGVYDVSIARRKLKILYKQ